MTPDEADRARELVNVVYRSDARRVRINEAAQIDAEVRACLKRAYEKA